jgi:hypothetical protein
MFGKKPNKKTSFIDIFEQKSSLSVKLLASPGVQQNPFPCTSTFTAEKNF